MDSVDPGAKPNLGDVAAKARATAMLGQVVSGRYRIVELIAMGGVGAVYLAEHVHMHKHVAVKILHPDPHGLPELVLRFEREAVAGAHIDHPNVAAATDFGKLDDGSCFLVLEYVRGTTLRDVIRRGPIAPARATRIAKQIAAALGAAHARGIVHRDVKPRNVMLIEGERDVVKLIDFGLAKLDLKQVSEVVANRASFDEERITTSGAVFGTIAYLAPEAALGMDTVDARADFYALGLVLYELLAGKHPFDVSDPVELFRQHHKVKPPAIGVRSPGVVVPPSLEAVVMRLLEKLPEARYDDAASVIAALDAALDADGAPVAPLQLGDAVPVFPGPSIAPLPPDSVIDASPPPVVTMAEPKAPPVFATAAEGPPTTKRADRVKASSSAWQLGLGAAAVVIAVGVGVAATQSSREPAAPVARPTIVTSAVTPVTSVAATTSSVAASVSSSPSSVPSAEGSASSPTAGPMDGPAMRSQLRRAAAVRDWVRGEEALVALAGAPDGLHDATLLGPARDVAAAAALAGGERADRIFAALSERAGADGLDVLYEIVRTRGGSKAATRALDLLGKPAVIARATPALRVTVALREAPCPEKAAMLDRAAAAGDQRTLVVMETVAAACLGNSSALEAAEKALKARLR